MSNKPYALHAAQLKSLQILKLGIEVHNAVAALHEDFVLGDFSIETGRSDFNHETSSINVRMRVRMGHFLMGDMKGHEKEDDSSAEPISLVAEVGGVFNINTEEFPEQHIHHWAETNAPLILYPYLREQVYGLSTRVGIKQVLLPLLEIPTFKFVKN
ncbi:protein-export chaperone SecB [Erwinia billingiae]|uniref:protein-export chaperone SecB n=1 Tax=Erwinia billingiae TaxID=182337 RepID=UPI00069F6FAE|nr:protein-export chaperone SecB [Erwinia billingiae]